MSASNRAQVEVSEKEIAAAENKAAAQKAEVELTEAKRRLGKAETELDVVKDVLWKAQKEDPVDAQRVAKAEHGVAEAKLGVAKAELGVAKAEWRAAPENQKAVFLAIVETAQKIVETANKAYDKALGPPTATLQQGESSQPNKHCQASLDGVGASGGGHSSWLMWLARPVFGTVSLHFVALVFWSRAFV